MNRLSECIPLARKRPVPPQTHVMAFPGIDHNINANPFDFSAIDPWPSPVEMLQAVFRTLRAPWVRDYLLHRNHDAAQDAVILASPENTKRALTRVFHCVGPVPAHEDRILVPYVSFGAIGVGVAVGKSMNLNPNKRGDSTRIARFSVDGNDGSVLIIYDTDNTDTDTGLMITATYQLQGLNSQIHACLQFERASFLRAIQSPSIDFNTLHASLATSIVRNDPIATNYIPNHVAYPFQVPEFSGSAFIRSTVSVYTSTVPLMKFQVGVPATWSPIVQNSTIEGLKSWGIAYDLGKNPPSIPQAIGPPAKDPNQVEKEQQEYERQVAQLENRKIRRREAAARSHSRKKERKRLAALKEQGGPSK